MPEKIKSSLPKSYLSMAPQDVIDKFNDMLKEKGYDFKVTFKNYPIENFMEQVSKLKASGEQVDLISSSAEIGINNNSILEYINKDLVLDISDYMASEKGLKIIESGIKKHSVLLKSMEKIMVYHDRVVHRAILLIW